MTALPTRRPLAVPQPAPLSAREVIEVVLYTAGAIAAALGLRAAAQGLVRWLVSRITGTDAEILALRKVGERLASAEAHIEHLTRDVDELKSALHEARTEKAKLRETLAATERELVETREALTVARLVCRTAGLDPAGAHLPKPPEKG